MANTRILALPFEYFEPKSLKEAVELLGRYGEGAKIIAGGTDLLVRMKQGALSPSHLIDIKRIPTLDRLVEDGSTFARKMAISCTIQREIDNRRKRIPFSDACPFGWNQRPSI